MDPEEKRFRRDGIFLALLIALWIGLVWVTNTISCDVRAIDDVEDFDDDDIAMSQGADMKKWLAEKLGVKIQSPKLIEAPGEKLVPENDFHMEGIRDRIERLERILTLAAQYVPRYDDDGRPLPLKKTIDTELGVMT